MSNQVVIQDRQTHVETLVSLFKSSDIIKSSDLALGQMRKCRESA